MDAPTPIHVGVAVWTLDLVTRLNLTNGVVAGNRCAMRLLATWRPLISNVPNPPRVLASDSHVHRPFLVPGSMVYFLAAFGVAGLRFIR